MRAIVHALHDSPGAMGCSQELGSTRREAGPSTAAVGAEHAVSHCGAALKNLRSCGTW
jgi:hypothetical protein